jgi:TonB-linked SusC/RagA family outer membrane protein
MKNNYSRLKWVALIIIGGILFFLSKAANAATTIPLPLQQQEVSGVVRDQNGLPIPGVTVSIKNTNRGTVTNLDGEYNITAPANGTLVFSYIGYKTVEIPVDNKEEISIQLEEDVSALGEVQINAGYYNTTERERTGNISRVSGEEIELQPVTSPIEALQGRMAGVEVIQQTGIPGAAPTIRIRGQNSLRTQLGNNGNLPLYIIDGMPVNSSPVASINQFTSTTGTDPLSGINLANIKSIEVLKDADATAIYGSRGANGVVLITTKNKTLKAKDELQVVFYSGFSRVANFLDLMDTPQYLALRGRAFQNDQVEPTSSNAEDLLLWDQDRQTNWQKELFGHSAPIENTNISYAGGNGQTSFRAGASYTSQGNVFPGNHKFEKKTANLSLNHSSKDGKFTVNALANYGITHSDLFSSANFVATALNLPPNAPALYNEDGSLNWAASSWTNPVAILESDSENSTKTLVSNLNLEYKILPGFSLKSNFGYTTLYNDNINLLPIQISDPAIWNRVSNRSQHSQSNRESWSIEPQLNYSTDIGTHHLDLIIGTTFQRNSNHQVSLSATGYANRHLIGNLNAADAVSVTTDQDVIYKYQAVFARVGYNLEKTYFINLTGRRDGSSRFGTNKRFANFGAIGMGWIFSQNSFISDYLGFLNFGKLRASYGITGNDQIGDYRYLNTYEATPGPGGLYPTRLTNPVFSWESNKKLEAAIELGFFDNVLSMDFSWYRNRSSNQLVGYTLPAITGFTSVEANFPATIENSGIELVLSGRLIKSKNFNWQASANISFPKSKLIEFEGIEETPYATQYSVGYPLNTMRFYSFDGIDPETGFFRVDDVNEDGSYDDEDLNVFKDLSRTYYGGFSNRISLKGIHLNFLMEFVKQQGLSHDSGIPGFQTNIIADGRYGPDGSPATTFAQEPTQAITGFRTYRNYLQSSERPVDASYVRMKSINLSYNLPKKLIQQLPFTGFNIFLQGQNLFTLTNYSGLDPQNPNSTNLPQLQSVTAGLQLNF